MFEEKIRFKFKKKSLEKKKLLKKKEESIRHLLHRAEEMNPELLPVFCICVLDHTLSLSRSPFKRNIFISTPRRPSFLYTLHIYDREE